MFRRFRKAVNVPVAMSALIAAAWGQQPASRPASNKVWTMPRTPDGQPALEGIWNNATLTPLQRPVELGRKEFYTEEEVRAVEKKLLQEGNRDLRDGSREADVAAAYNDAWYDRGTRLARTGRTSLIVDPPDGRIPGMTPEASKKWQAIQAKLAEHPADGPEDRPMHERCLLFSQVGPPMIPANYNDNYQIVQATGYVAILAEMGDEVRIIPLDGRPHLAQSVQQWMGDSRGRWEGNTLVVETTNVRVNDRSRFEPSFVGMTDENLRITERFTRTGPDSILYRATIDDPTVYTQPWTIEVSMEKVETPVFEYACHEGNYAMLGILGGARAQEKKPAEQKGGNR